MALPLGSFLPDVGAACRPLAHPASDSRDGLMGEFSRFHKRRPRPLIPKTPGAEARLHNYKLTIITGARM